MATDFLAMIKTEETNLIWKSVKGAKDLFDLYGYYPTLHDASITNFDINFIDRQLTLTFEYRDVIEREINNLVNTDIELTTIIVVRWSGVSKSTFELNHNDIYEMSFQKSGKQIHTLFPQSSGINGHIMSENIEVISVEKSK